MRPTAEQEYIINHKDDAVVTAVAGSGKTHTLILYAKERPDADILYVAFNKSIKTEAQHKFKKHGIKNIEVLTAHGLAYKSLGGKIKVCNGYSLTEIIEICNIKAKRQDDVYVAATLIRDGFTIYCNIAASTLTKEHLMLSFPKDTVDRFYDVAVAGVKILADKMKSGEIPFIHDYYLKLYQISKPRLPYTHILFDEAQDASPVMLDIIKRQEDACRIICGDKSQSIYGYRLATNALDILDFRRFTLSKSFRFGQTISNMSNNILTWKRLIGCYGGTVEVVGAGGTSSLDSLCYLSRSNAGVLKSAIVAMENHRPDKIYFEGGKSGYSFMSRTSPIFDVLSIFCKRYDRVKNPELRHLRNIQQLQEFAAATGNQELKTCATMVLAYQTNLYPLINKIKATATDKREDAHITFSTVHKAKGMEYDDVRLSDDFISFGEVKEFAEEELAPAVERFGWSNLPMPVKIARARMEEEINILYVAVTRTKNRIFKDGNFFS